MGDQDSKTPLLDELERGPWPSFVKEIKKAGEKSPVCGDLLGQLELSYEEKKGHWKHGGIVGVLGYGGGVIGRYSDRAGQVSERRALSHAASQPARRVVLHERCHPDPVRHLGTPRVGPDEHARRDRRHRVPGHEDRRARADLQGTDGSRLRSGRVGLLPAHPVMLRRPGAMRVGLLRHDGDVRPADPRATRTKCTARRSPTSSRSSSPAVRTTAWRRSRAPICRSSAPGRTTSSRTTARWPSTRRPASTSRRTSATAARRGA